jgi:hypothetical protein
LNLIDVDEDKKVYQIEMIHFPLEGGMEKEFDQMQVKELN